MAKIKSITSLTNPDCFVEFEFDLSEALLRALISVLDDTPMGQLSKSSTSAIPNAQGVYQLFYDEQLVYIGKTDAEAGLRTRLSRHADKIKDRPTLSGKVSYKAVRILVFTAMDLETQLIKHYSKKLGSVEWNGSGFGSNDPGRRRETTNARPDGFDVSFPINIDTEIEVAGIAENATMSVAEALKALKKSLFYTLRFQTIVGANGKAQRGQLHEDLLQAKFVVPSNPYTTRTLLRAILNVLGSEWQATVFASHVILYKENTCYEFGMKI